MTVACFLVSQKISLSLRRHGQTTHWESLNCQQAPTKQNKISLKVFFI